ncbi:hypothetical protein WMF04_17705 [Sorangium sp. So ce260]|uniref:hypothetical protein n=1 Tax=Sorangium sp. So ce260 TaxID=3133291 RepID=UPI003F5E07D7
MKLRAALIAPASVLALAGCGEEPTPVAVEALSQSGRSAFVCLAVDRPDPEEPGVVRSLPITDCSRRTAESPGDFGIEEGKATVPHLYALVTQTSRGEIAVIDMTTETAPILDQDTGTPGASFLPVGARPVDIAATPGGTASFVAVAEPGRAGIFALPSAKVLPRGGCPVPSLSSWPVCSLPSPPGEMLLVSDPPGPDGKLRASCSSDYDVDPTSPGDAEAGGDACSANGDLSQEGLGRQKLLVTMPELGGFAVIDAQTLLEDERYQEGGFAPCEVERWVPLEVSLPSSPPAAPPDEAPDGPAACVAPAAAAGPTQAVATPRPAGLALAGDRLFIADLDAPVIHVVDLPTPCEPTELPPLLPAATLDPERVVTTTRVAVSQALPPDFRRYLYAVDAGDGSVMVFDVSDGASGRSPLARPHAEWNPFQPPDRIRLTAPVRDLAVVQRDAPAILPATGVAPEGLRCDPDPGLKPCDSNVASCDIETLYRTTASRDAGAGPLKLRGSFAYLMLMNGQVAVVDVDDLDAACRGPEQRSLRAGCAEGASEGGKPLETSGEASCNVVLPHALRSQRYVATSDATGELEPGVQGLPLLYDRSGTVVPLSSESPKMRATFPSDAAEAPALTLAVGAERATIEPADSGETALDEQGLVLRSGELRHALTLNVEDPRVHLVNETWTVAYEGVLPGLTRTFVHFDEDAALRSGDARFCRRGVQSRASIREQLLAAGVPEADARAAALADFVQITSELPGEDAEYWDKADPAVCSFDSCNAKYGSVITSRPGLRVAEAYEDHLALESRDPAVDEVAFAACCFPGEVQLGVRAAGQWVVRSNAAGFLHHVIADPVTGKCRNSCDARLGRLNGRVVHTPVDGRVTDGDLGAFVNPMFRFAITGGVPEQDMQFRFTTQGAFNPLLVELVDNEAELQPQAIRFVPATGELAITDGSFQGLILLGGSGAEVVRRFN